MDKGAFGSSATIIKARMLTQAAIRRFDSDGWPLLADELYLFAHSPGPRDQ
jgi:hypothetical protein